MRPFVQHLLQEQMAERLVHQVRQDGGDHRQRHCQHLAFPSVEHEADEGAYEEVARQEHEP